MAETLLAILLVTTSAKESNLVFRWPELPKPSPRLARARPDSSLSISQFDNPWRASHSQAEVEEAPNIPAHDFGRDPDYCWQRPNALLNRAMGTSCQLPLPRGATPAGRFNYADQSPMPDEYAHVLGYSAEFLAKNLCPHRSMCHQKFELVVDDLAFIGHPVCVESDGAWRFKPEKLKAGSRGRGSRDPQESLSPRTEEHPSMSPEVPASDAPAASKSTWLHTFHLVLVLDLPDPSSAASGNLSKYFNILYEQIAFILTAVLYQEQVLSNFVEMECDALIRLKERCISKGRRLVSFASSVLTHPATSFCTR